MMARFSLLLAFLLLLLAVLGSTTRHHKRHVSRAAQQKNDLDRDGYRHKNRVSYRNGLAAVPVVLWHGMGDSCCNPLTMGRVISLIEDKVPGIYVHSLRLGENMASDTERGFLGNMNELVQMACDMIKNDTALSQGYNAIGLSQGGLFLRAVAQRCPDPPVKNLISLGGPQQGIFGLPYCTGPNILCNTIRRLLDLGAYISYVQNNVVQAQYWHDANNEQNYREDNIFLADINNEKAKPNAAYKTNLQKLKNFVLFKWKGDHMVVPKDSEWFGYYKEGDMATVLPMNETRLYKEDLIGLRKLAESGRLHFVEVEGEHLQLTPEIFTKEIIEKYLV